VPNEQAYLTRAKKCKNCLQIQNSIISRPPDKETRYLWPGRANGYVFISFDSSLPSIVSGVDSAITTGISDSMG
jgi:hypothetical protein